MTNGTNDTNAVELESLVETHDLPFVVIDQDYHILATNRAYQQVYGTDACDAIGGFCYKLICGNDTPCHELGKACPHREIFINGNTQHTLHGRCDADDHVHQLRVTAYPLQMNDGMRLMGTLIEDISSPANDAEGKPQQRLVGQSKPFLACVDQLNLAASSDATVLLQGETGSGKELAARYIHSHSSRQTAPFLAVDCGAYSGQEFELELFGRADERLQRQADDTPGLFELASEGTLLLDDITELGPAQQARLLRVLETGQYRPVGGRSTLRTQARVICATSQHLWEAVLAGQFRQDLYYRIACLNVHIPKLSERLADIPLLANNLLASISRAMRKYYRLTDAAQQRLMNYHYPGNVRELRNILSIAATRSSNAVIDAEQIQQAIFDVSRIREQTLKSPAAVVNGLLSTNGETRANATQPQNSLHAIEAQYINELLQRYGGNRRKVANALGVSVRTLYRKLNRYNLS